MVRVVPWDCSCTSLVPDFDVASTTPTERHCAAARKGVRHYFHVVPTCGGMFGPEPVNLFEHLVFRHDSRSHQFGGSANVGASQLENGASPLNAYLDMIHQVTGDRSFEIEAWLHTLRVPAGVFMVLRFLENQANSYRAIVRPTLCQHLADRASPSLPRRWEPASGSRSWGRSYSPAASRQAFVRARFLELVFRARQCHRLSSR